MVNIYLLSFFQYHSGKWQLQQIKCSGFFILSSTWYLFAVIFWITSIERKRHLNSYSSIRQNVQRQIAKNEELAFLSFSMLWWEKRRWKRKYQGNEKWFLDVTLFIFLFNTKNSSKMTRFFPYMIVTKFHGIKVCFTFIPLYFLKVKYRNLRFLCPEQ